MSMGALTLAILGTFAALKLPVDLVPAVEYPRCTVVTHWPGKSPEDVERWLTSPIEAMSHTVRGVRRANSVSEEGVSRVDIELDGRRKPSAVRSELRDRLRDPGLLLPRDVLGPAVEEYIPPAVRDVRGFMVYVLNGDGSLADVGRLAKERVAPPLQSVPGVASVDVLGMPLNIRRAAIHPGRARALGLRATAVTAALQDATIDSSFSPRGRRGRRWSVSAGAGQTGASETRSAALGLTPHGNPVSLAAVATMVDSMSEPEVEVRIGGRPGVMLHIDRQAGTNALVVARAVRERVEGLALPSGAKMHLQTDRTSRLEKELHRMRSHAAAALASVMVLLVLWLRSARQAVVVVSVPVVSIGATMLVLAHLGVGLNLFSMAGLVLGLGRLVDDAIVVVHHLRWRLGGTWSGEAVAEAMPDIVLPVCVSTAVAIAALGGSAAAPDGLRPLLADFSVAAASSLAASCAASLTLVPALLCAAAGRGTDSQAGIGPAAWYTLLLRTCLKHPRSVVAVAVLLLGIPLWAIPGTIPGDSVPARFGDAVLKNPVVRQARSIVEPLVGGAVYYFVHSTKFREMLAEEGEPRLVFWASFPHGTPRDIYRAVALRVERAVMTFLPSHQTVLVQVGAEYCVVVVEFDEATAASNVPAAVRGMLISHAASLSMGSVVVSGFGPSYSGGFEGGATFVVRIAGYRYETVRSIAEAFCARIRSHPRVAAVDMDRSFVFHEEMYQVIGTPRRDLLDRAGLRVAGLAGMIRQHTLGTALEANEAETDTRPPMVVVEGPGGVKSLDALAGSLLPREDGGSEKLSDLIDFHVRRTPARIMRERQQYVRWITLEYRGPEAAGALWVDDVLSKLPRAPGYACERMHPAGSLAGSDAGSAALVGGISLLASWMIAAAAYNSLALPALALLTVPFSLVGVFLIFPAADIPFGRGGVVASLLLVGIVAANGIVFVDRLRLSGSAQRLTHAQIINGAQERFRPVLMTAGATVAGIAPLLFTEPASGAGFSLAAGLVAGLVSGTVLTLLVLPVVLAVVTRAGGAP